MSEPTRVPERCRDCHCELGQSFSMVNVTVKEGRKKRITLVGPLCDDCANRRKKDE